MGVDYAMLIKLYGNPVGPDTRWSSGEVIGTETVVVTGNPDLRHVSNSYLERQNLSKRTSMGRFTRLTNAQSRKLANHQAAIALHYKHYNLCRIDQTLRVPPAMEAGISNHVWPIEEFFVYCKRNCSLFGGGEITSNTRRTVYFGGRESFWSSYEISTPALTRNAPPDEAPRHHYGIHRAIRYL
jgi:hypothetical protein